MRKGFVITLFLAILLICFANCKKSLEKYNEDWKGLWKTDTITLTASGKKVVSFLNIDGKKSYLGILCEDLCLSRPCGCNMSAEGKAKIDKSRKHIYIGTTFSDQLRIFEEPYLGADGRWTCKVGDFTYYKN